MCGIIGIASNKSVSINIINALKKLEYRGYDSAGLATISNGEISEKKCPGRVEKLEKILFQNPSEGNLGIGHVRWATHGVPNEINAHPHSSEIVSVVHNGIIENSDELKKDLEKSGKVFKSQTDTEVITVLLTEKIKKLELLDSESGSSKKEFSIKERFSNKTAIAPTDSIWIICKAVFETLDMLKGSFALGIIFKNYKDFVIGARRGSPLAVGYSNSENYLGSDSYALKSMTNKISYLDDGDVCVLSKDNVQFYNSNKNKINKEIFTLSEEKSSVSKGNYKNFMIKEIFEQPITTKTCLKEYIDEIREEINFYNLPIDPKKINKIVLIGCGTAYHSCLVAKYWLEEFTTLSVETDIASEFRYRKNRFNKNNLYIFVSQSGETADTYAALDLCKKEKVKTCSVVNVVESSIARNSDCVLPIHAGPEIGVASTKAFLGQILVLYLLSLKISQIRKDIDQKKYKKKIAELKKIPKLISESLNEEEKIQLIAKDIYKSKGSMFLGRGFSFPIALEGALKLKELSYLHAEGYPAGEMKHGPLALIEDGLPVVVIAPKDKYFEKTLSNMQEVIARGGKVLLITNSGGKVISENIRFQIDLPESDLTLTPFLFTIPLQLLSYHVALFKKCDIDKPRNLAKSVTVE